MAQRALDMMIEYAPQRVTFGKPLSSRQTVQNWIADAATRIHAMRLMTYDCAWKIDEGRDTRQEISMIKSYCTEAAYDIVDHAMQMFGGMGMTREMPLYLLSNKLRTMRITMDQARSTIGWSRAICLERASDQCFIQVRRRQRTS
jgi:alkylation response protein AidB-like acyl-CoA dehydrogenase